MLILNKSNEGWLITDEVMKSEDWLIWKVVSKDIKKLLWEEALNDAEQSQPTSKFAKKMLNVANQWICGASSQWT